MRFIFRYDFFSTHASRKKFYLKKKPMRFISVLDNTLKLLLLLNLIMVQYSIRYYITTF